jgi:hypothetical protein
MPPKRTTAATPKKTPSGAKERAEAVKRILLNVEKKMEGSDLKATLGDYIKLLQLQKEMGEEPARELKVTWVEPTEPTTEE